MKIYRNVYLKGYKKFPYQKLTGRNTLLYKGRVVCGIVSPPDDYNPKMDLYIDCDCDFSKWRCLKKVFQ